MKSQVEIKNKSEIDDILDKAQYGTLSLCMDNKPYSVPINFVKVDDMIYFHGSKKGKKMEFIKNNAFASFSVVESYSMIQSYFRSEDKLACPASHFFKSVCIDGKIELVEKYSQKAFALESLMKKLQPEGKYKSLDNGVYKKLINATQVFKLIPDEIKGKVKLGQQLSKEQFDSVIEHLKQRGNDIDKSTIKNMIETKGK